MSASVVIVFLILSVIWGSTWLVIKVGLEDLPPLTFAVARFVIAAALLFGVVLVRRVPLPRNRKDWTLLAVTGVLSFTINYGAVFWGEQHVSSGLAALLQATIPAFGLVIAHYYLPGERMTVIKIIGVLLGIAGVGLILSNQVSDHGMLALLGSAVIVLGAFAAAYANVLVKARGGHLHPAMLAFGQMIFGLVPLLVAGLATEGNPAHFNWTPRAWLSVLYLAVVGSSLAFMLYYWLVKNMDVTKTMLIALVTPLIAVVLGMAVLGESLTWRIVTGGAAILCGIGLITLRSTAHGLTKNMIRKIRHAEN
ncbi:MAG TPA: EamA family transporter [Blastocatellia bacterium]|nr:EamA family transporter [Blastocatellia bacterium]